MFFLHGLPGLRVAITAAAIATSLPAPAAAETADLSDPVQTAPDNDVATSALQPEWVTAQSTPTEAGKALLKRLDEADDHGLFSQDYAIQDIRSALDRRTPEQAARLMEAAYLRYAADMLKGRGSDLTSEGSLRAAIATAPHPGAFLDFLAPVSKDYARLKKALIAHRLIEQAGGWPTVPTGPMLRPGDEDRRVLDLRKRLVASGDLASYHFSGALYDAAVEAAVERFQGRHGLTADGIVGPRTLAAMNVPAAERVRQMVINLDRLRRQDQSEPDLHIVVNVAGQELSVRRAGNEIARMRVAVGQPDWPTPIFSDKITYLEFNPYWNVPASITREELAVQEASNPGTLEQRGFEALLGYGGEVIPIAMVDWPYAARTGRLPVVLRQRPGPNNALGRVKFMFPNKHSVYLHDTPDKRAFKRGNRAISHGCVRVEDPQRLAHILLTMAGRAAPEDVDGYFALTDRTVVPLKQPVPVHMVYVTAWVDAADVVHFRDDIYDRDSYPPGNRQPLGEVLASADG